MNKNSPTEDDALEEALSPIVNRLIDKNYETSQDKISSQMAPLIGSAIREQIKSQKDDVVDALYPVLGNMISRYVTKTLEDMLSKINAQIQDGLSIKSLKRKLKAKIQGVSESELLLNENATANIRALLLIHKETGIVLAHSENPNKPVSEPEMLASMMTAIRSFVNDWIEQNSDSQELGEIEYGGNKIIIEASGYSYLAVIVEGSAYRATYDKIRETLENIVLHHGDSIREFNGDLDKFANIEIYREISILLDPDTKPKEDTKKRAIHPLMFLIPSVLLLWGGYSYYKSYLNEKLTQTITQRLYQTPQLTSYRLGVYVKDGIVKLEGSVPFEYHKQLAQRLAQNIDGVTKVNNELLVIDSLQDPMQVSSNIAYLLRGLNAQKGVNLSYTYDYTLLKIKGWVWNTSLLRSLKNELQSVPNIQKIEYDVTIRPPLLKSKIYFKKASTELTPLAQAQLIKTIQLIKNLDKEYILTLTSYSDQVGSTLKNLELSKKRVTNTMNFLRKQGDIEHKFKTLIKETPPKGIDAKDNPQNARCIIINYIKREKNASL